jgi:uncharacterized protein YggT (Ycf19 family)
VNVLDFILNLAALLLWLNWRASSMPEPAALPGKSLAATLRRAGGPRRADWGSLLLLVAILLVRALFYWQIGRALDWTALLDAQTVKVAFSSHFADRMLLYSLLTFGRMLLLAYAWLLLLSILQHGEPMGHAQRLVAWQLGRVHRWPPVVKALLPFVLGTLAWAGLNAWLGGTLYLPEPEGAARLWAQSAAVGAVVYFAWLPLLTALLVLHLVESYVYLGKSAFWDFTSACARGLLRPLQKIPLRAGRVDLMPLVMLAALIALAIYGRPWITKQLVQLVY